LLEKFRVGTKTDNERIMCLMW